MQTCIEKPKTSSPKQAVLNDKILIIAGETSGDKHGADLVADLKKKHPNLQCYAMGSQNLEKAGAKIILDSNELSVVGFVEILKIFNKIRNAFKVIKSFIKKENPKLVILIDYPGFNLRIAKYAKKQGCKVMYYISPQLWAWREGRIKIIKKYVDKMAVIFPFEVDFYRQHGVNAIYAGNPLMEQLPLELTRENARKSLELCQSATIVGLLPGSRKAEIARMLPIQIEAARLLLKEQSDIEFLLPLADSLAYSDIASYLDDTLPIRVIENNRFHAIKACNAVIATSGTVTLETALLGTPLVIAYRGSAISYFIAKKLVKIKHIGLCNIVAGQTIAPELIQDKATPKQLQAQINIFMHDRRNLQQFVNFSDNLKAVLTPSLTENILNSSIEQLLSEPS